VYQPDVLVIALGLDASIADPLAFLSITTDGFSSIGKVIGQAGLPTLFIQEGGYISPVLGDNLVATLKGFEDTTLY
ncbi:histone deacetylase family protein, partial [Alphaproteobacteria bacterium]|nr:histone deacetylase family protein [Alphaproteobacteria bacterium]